MNDMPIITTKHNILDILKRPADFIDEYSDTEIMTLPDYEAAGGILRILVGVDEDSRYYLVLEDDDTAEDVYPRDEETLMETFVRVLDENISREPGITEVLHRLRKEYPNLDIECTCSACPEQYEIWDSEDEDYPQIGYLRLRGGQFTAEYPDAGGELVYKACPNGCTFFEDEERERYLTDAVRACVERHKQSK